MRAGALGYFTGLAREDYYTKGGEPPGLWHGEGAEALGLSGQVSKDELRHLFRGLSPDGTEKLVQNAGTKRADGRPAHHPGWDATFSAPKSVSVLWSQAPEDVRREIQRAHLEAVRQAMSHVEAVMAYTRRGKGGELIEKARGLVVAAYEHGTSRAQDPNLHTHCLIMNVVPRWDGTTGTIHGLTSSERGKGSGHKLPLYEVKLTAGALYRAALAAELQARLGLGIERREDFGFELAGVSKRLIENFSKRRGDVEEELRSLGRTDAKSAEKATLFTRARKAHIPREELFKRWQEEGRGHPMPEASRGKAKNEERQLSKTFAAAFKTTMGRHHIFTMSQFLRNAAENSYGRAVDAATITREAEGFLQRNRNAVSLGQVERDSVYTTREVLNFTERVLHHLRGLEKRRGSIRALSKRAVDKAIKKAGETDLTPETKKALSDLLRQRSAGRTLEALSQLERMRALAVARTAWEAKGHRVFSVSPTWRDVKSMALLTGVRSYTAQELASKTTLSRTHLETLRIMQRIGREQRFYSLQSFLKFAERVKKGPAIRFDKKTVLILDQAHRIDPRELALLTERISKAGGTVITTDVEAQAKKAAGADREQQHAQQQETQRQEQQQQQAQQQTTGRGR